MQNHGSLSCGFLGLTAMPHRPVGRLMRHEQERREARPEAACAAETGRPLPLFSRPLQQTHGASPKGSTLPFTMQNETLGARGASPRVRSSMLSGGGAGTAGTRHPSRGNAAAHGGEGTLLAAGPREACSYFGISMQRLEGGRVVRRGEHARKPATSADPCSATSSRLFSTPRTRP
jgi:hypothetical protein